jgi:hypothetical protein
MFSSSLPPRYVSALHPVRETSFPFSRQKNWRVAKKKAEKEALLAAEEAALPSKPKSAPKAGSKKKETPVAKPGGLNNFSIDDPLNLRSGRDENRPVEEFGATGIEGMLEALEVVNQKTDKQSMGAKVCER